MEAGIPLAAPTINEVAVVMLFGLFGWKVAGRHIVSGLLVAIVAGFIIGCVQIEKYVAGFVWKGQCKAEVTEKK